MRPKPLALAAIVLLALVCSRVSGGDEEKKREKEPRRVVTAEQDPCQWVTAALPCCEDSEATAFHGPFFLTYLAPGEPLSIVVEQEGTREGLLLARISELEHGGRIFVPARAWVVAPKGSAPGRLYSGFRPYPER